ncbi:MAG: bifunctional 4-hydroxy-2-oxoglutarate aldolase/2-dehydro-3-deoxy-phosphogluconate aldolase [Actinomycetes bacterium]
MSESQYNSGVVAVIRTDNPQHALNLGRAFADTAISAIEVTMTVPDAMRVIQTLVDEGIERVGAGTVRTVEQVREIKRIGGTFVVSPHLEEAIVKTSVDLGLASTPGTMTPSEIVQAINWGATSQKVFPVSLVGGQAFVKAVLEPLPDARLVVSGGVQPEEVQDYLALGCVSVCMGGALWTPEIADTGDIQAIRAYALTALSRM